jgi:hypothetical protein
MIEVVFYLGCRSQVKLVSDALDSFRMDKTIFSVGSLGDASDDRAFWRSKSPDERLAALEFLRMVHYGYDPATTRLQRVLVITELGKD